MYGSGLSRCYSRKGEGLVEFADNLLNVQEQYLYWGTVEEGGNESYPHTHPAGTGACSRVIPSRTSRLCHITGRV